MTTEQYKQALLLAGKLAVAARRLTAMDEQGRPYIKMEDISNAILRLHGTLRDYDEFMIDVTIKESKGNQQ